MPRSSRGPHLYLKRRGDGSPIWYIRDGRNRISTQCGEGDRLGARQAFERYVVKTTRLKFGHGDPASVSIASVIALYAQDKGGNVARPREAAARLARILAFFGEKVIDDVTPSSCAAYVTWRDAEQAARRELEDLRAAILHAYRSRKLAVPIPVALPPKAAPRDRWLTRSEAARLLAGAMGFRFALCSDVRTRRERRVVWSRDGERNRHVARFILIGLYTATRHDAILRIGWRPHANGGYVDLERGRLYRRAPGVRETKKRTPPFRLPDRLLAHLSRWSTLQVPGLYIVSWEGSRLGKMRRAWRSAVELAGLDQAVTPHVLRHTYVTWQLQNGASIWDTAHAAGMSPELVERVYGHHAVDFQDRVATPFRAPRRLRAVG